MKELQLLLLILKSEENLEIPGVLELLLLVEAMVELVTALLRRTWFDLAEMSTD